MLTIPDLLIYPSSFSTEHISLLDAIKKKRPLRHLPGLGRCEETRYSKSLLHDQETPGTLGRYIQPSL